MRTLIRRVGALAAVMAFGATAVVLLLADRGTALGRRALRSGADGLHLVERVTGFDAIDRSDLPGTIDQVGHVGLWAIGTVLVGAGLRFSSSTGRHWPIAPVTVGVLMACLSMLIELAQPLLSQTRTAQIGDMIANGIGVGTGVVVLLGMQTADRLLRLVHLTR